MSGTNPVGFLSGSACMLNPFLSLGSLHLSFPNSFLSAITLFPVPSSDITTRGKSECGLKVWFGLDVEREGASVM